MTRGNLPVGVWCHVVCAATVADGVVHVPFSDSSDFSYVCRFVVSFHFCLVVT